MFDTNQDPTDHDGKGSLNADYATRLKNFLALYNTTDLDYSKGYAKFDLGKELNDCAHFPYGFVSEEKAVAIKPCIFLKLNNIWAWQPEPIEAGDFEDHPDWPESSKRKRGLKRKCPMVQAFSMVNTMGIGIEMM